MVVGALGLALLGLVAPRSAHAEACTGLPASTTLTTVEFARTSVRVEPGRSIGPIAVGMTRRQIARVAGAPLSRDRSGQRRYRVHGLPVVVGFGYRGRARTLQAYSGRLVVAGVRMAAGAGALKAALPGLQVSDCGAAWTEGFLPTGSPLGARQTGFAWNPSPRLPSVTIVDHAMRRAG
ncbi:MAG: hypothetical protein U0869_26330 [Chloroflexota bacterium]